MPDASSAESDLAMTEVPRLPPIATRSRLPAWRALFAGLVASFALLGSDLCEAEPRPAIAMHGEPALPADYAAMPYVNPAAPKGGRLIQGVLGTFDSLNPFIVKGLA